LAYFCLSPLHGATYSHRAFFCPKTKGTTADPCNEHCIAVQQQYRSSNIITTATAVQLAHGAAWETGGKMQARISEQGETFGGGGQRRTWSIEMQSAHTWRRQTALLVPSCTHGCFQRG